MSYAEKPEDITREEWMEKLNNVHIQRADMNRLIMNYLVTGEVSFCGFCYRKLGFRCLYLKPSTDVSVDFGSGFFLMYIYIFFFLSNRGF